MDSSFKIIEFNHIDDLIIFLSEKKSLNENKNLIINLLSIDNLLEDNLKQITIFSNEFKTIKQKSFILIINQLAYENFPEELSIAPSEQEAIDLVEMEEIERDLLK